MTREIRKTWDASPRVRESFGFVALLAIMALPLLAVKLPPLNDLMGHMGRYAVQTELASRPALQSYYAFHWQMIGNLGVDLLVELLHPWLGIEGSVRFVVLATQLLGSAGILATSKVVHGRITPFAIAALPLLYGFPFFFGLVNFALAMALALLTYAGWMLSRQRCKGVWPQVMLGVTGCAIWLCHTYGWAFLGLLCGSASLSRCLEKSLRPLPLIREILAECWPLLIPLIPMLVWRAGTSGSETNDWSILLKVKWLASALRTNSFTADLLSLQALTLLAYWAFRNKRSSIDWRLGFAALFCAVSFFILPARVFGSYFADMRLVPYAYALALLAIFPRDFSRHQMRWLTGLALVFLVGRTAITTSALVRREHTLSSALMTVDAVPKGARLATLVIEPCTAEWAPPLLWHIGSMALLRRSAFVNDQWQEPGMSLLSIRFPKAPSFERDPSQLVQPDDCTNAKYPRLSDRMKALPHNAFSNVWIIGDLPHDLPHFAGLRLLDHQGSGALFSILQTPISASAGRDGDRAAMD